jgi:hypothetical protein
MSEQLDSQPAETAGSSDWGAQNASAAEPSNAPESSWENSIAEPDGDDSDDDSTHRSDIADDEPDDGPDAATSDGSSDASDRPAPASSRGSARRPRAKISYKDMTRIEGRATQRELRQLNALRIDLMAKRTQRGGSRITNNTLIRVALDGLLAARRDLTGNDEHELRESFLQLLENGRNAADRASRPTASE